MYANMYDKTGESYIKFFSGRFFSFIFPIAMPPMSTCFVNSSQLDGVLTKSHKSIDESYWMYEIITSQKPKVRQSLRELKCREVIYQARCASSLALKYYYILRFYPIDTTYGFVLAAMLVRMSLGFLNWS